MLISTLVSFQNDKTKLEAYLRKLYRYYNKRFQLYRKITFAKKQAQSLNHMTILIEKAVLNIPIEKGESEMRSYIDIKKHFKESWPFMWQVKNVKDKELSVDKIYKCEPFSSYSYLDLVRD